VTDILQRVVGRDPYDALRGRRIPRVVCGSRFLRQLAIQARKTSVIDLAPVFGVAPFLMAKSLGSFLSAESRRAVVSGQCSDVRTLTNALLSDSSLARGDDGSWGYEFDVQTRWAFYAAGSPNIIATTFVARGLLESALVCGDEDARSSAVASARFVASVLPVDEGWLRYTTDSSVLIHNANLLGAGLLAAAGALTGQDEFTTSAVRAALISVGAQRADGSWPYGAGDGLEWCDNFHTAYNLDGLLHVWLATRDDAVLASLESGCEYWVRNFFTDDGAPAYFAGGGLPYDIHSAGTAIDVAARLSSHGFDTLGLARAVADWTREHLLAPDGTTYYRVGRLGTDRRHFVRWGDAHVALGLASLQLAETGLAAPLEAALVAKWT